MIALYIILGIILLIGLLLLSRVRLIINFDADLKVYLRFLFIKFNLFPEPSKLPKRKRKKKKKEISASSRSANDESSQKKKEDPLIKKLWSIREILLQTIERFLGKVHFKFVRLNVIVGCENAAATALLYGAASQGVAYLIETLDNISNVDISKSSEISVKSDFISQKSELNGKIVLYISVVHMIYVIIHFMKKFIKSKMGE